MYHQFRSIYQFLLTRILPSTISQPANSHGPPSAHQRNAKGMAFLWRADGDPCFICLLGCDHTYYQEVPVLSLSGGRLSVVSLSRTLYSPWFVLVQTGKHLKMTEKLLTIDWNMHLQGHTLSTSWWLLYTLILALTGQNLSSGSLTKRVSNQPAQLQRLARK